MGRLLLLIWFSVLLIPDSLNGQTAIYPSPGTLFDGIIHRIDLSINQDSLADLLKESNRWTNHSYPVTFVYDLKDTVTNCGIRLKGNTSRSANKKSFRIDFDEFEKKSFQGLKTFNLHGDHNDPSKVREFLTLYIMQKAGVTSLRSNLVSVYFNGIYMGLYSNTEYVNKTFIESRYNNKDGNLYKCTWPADLVWQGANQQVYKDLINPSPLNERAYELKTNETEDNYSDLVNLINTINNTSSQNLATSLDTIFDINAYLRILALEVLTGHWDNYYYNRNNYYLYHNTATRKFEYFPYDVDNTLGVQWGVPDINTRDIHNWGNLSSSKAPLTNKILQIDAFNRRYEAELTDIIQKVFNEDSLFPLIDTLRARLDPYILNDPFYNGTLTSDYGFDHNDFVQSFTSQVISFATFGIKPYISQRKQSALGQRRFTTSVERGVAGSLFQIYPNPVSDDLFIFNPGNKSIRVQIIDLNGTCILSGNVLPDLNKINLSGIRPGIYLLSLSADGNTLSEKLVIN